MAVYTTPEDNAANPPETWTVVKAAERVWNLIDQNGTVLDSKTTKRDAEALKTSGFIFKLYHQEAAWYAGVTPPGHRTWADCKAERERIEARWGRKVSA